MIRTLAVTLATLAATAALAAPDFASAPDLYKPMEIPGAGLPFDAGEGGGLKGLTIVMDPAGGHEALPGAPGATSATLAADANVLTTGHLYHHLVRAGAKAYTTRWDATPQSVEARRRRVADAKPNLVLTVRHMPGTQEEGLEPAPDAPLLEPVARELAADLGKMLGFDVKVSVASGRPLMATVWPGTVDEAAHAKRLATRGFHTDEAVALYRMIERARGEYGERLGRPAAGADATTGTGGFPDSLAAWPTLHEGVRAHARTLWPHERAAENAAEVQRMVDIYRRFVITEPVFFFLEPRVEKTAEGWVVSGKSSSAFLTSATLQLVAAAGCEPVIDRMEALPSERLGARRFGIVRAPMAMSWGSPREGDNVQTQLLLGETAFLLDESEDGRFLLLQGGEGYIGWVRADQVHRVEADEFDRWAGATKAVVRREFRVGDLRVPAGAALPLAKNGREVCLPPTAVEGVETAKVAADDIRRADGAQGLAAAKAAAEFLTTPYVFGGRSRLGNDCSGLTGAAWAAVGVTLPRDARQQVLSGRLVATPWHQPDLRAGDLLYFIDASGKVTHAGISIGGKRFLHSCPPEVQVSSLDPADPLYTALWHKHFALARRVTD